MSASRKNLGAFLSEDANNIYDILELLQKEVGRILRHGPINKGRILELSSDATCDIPSLSFPESFNIEDRVTFLALSDFLNQNSEPSPKNNFNYQEAYKHGMGSCEHYSFFALLVLSKIYDFDQARIESIKSDQVHTYVVVMDSNQKEYVLDLWSEVALEYGNDREWNECMLDEYKRKEGAKTKVEKTYSSSVLKVIAASLDSDNLVATRETYQAGIEAKAQRSFSSTGIVSSLNESLKNRKEKKKGKKTKRNSPNSLTKQGSHSVQQKTKKDKGGKPKISLRFFKSADGQAKRYSPIGIEELCLGQRNEKKTKVSDTPSPINASV